MAIVNKFNVNNKQVTLDADIIENMSANNVSYDNSFKYDENTVGDKLAEIEEKIKNKSSWSETSKSLLRTILNAAVFDSDQSANIEALIDSIVGGDKPISPVGSYSVTLDLTNCTSSNTATSVQQGDTYTTQISANEGFEIESVSCYMNSIEQHVSGNTISIESVSGNIVITASAAEPSINYITFNDSAVRDICIANFDNDGDGKISKIEAESVTTIGTFFNAKPIVTFDEFKYFKGITQLPNGANKSFGAFGDCTSLESIQMPSSLVIIGNHNFNGCTKLAEVDLGNVKTLGDSAFNSCPITSVDLSFVENVGTTCFSSLNMQVLNMPNIKTINTNAFGTSTIQEISLGASIISLANMAFRDVVGLTKVKILATTPPSYTYGSEITVKVFPSSTIVYVPDSAISNYQSHEQWGLLYNDGRVKPISEY